MDNKTWIIWPFVQAATCATLDFSQRNAERQTSDLFEATSGNASADFTRMEYLPLPKRHIDRTETRFHDVSQDRISEGNFGGSNGRTLQALSQPHQHQLPAGAAQPAALTHWQRIACITAATASAHGIGAQQQSQLNQQQNHLQQQQQQQQQPPPQGPQIRYFQIPKQATSQYIAQVPGANHQQHYTQHYAIVAAASNSVVPERSNPRKREAAQYSYFTTPFAQKSTTLTHTLTLRTLDDYGPHLQLPQLGTNQQSHQQRYQILTNGHSVTPGEVSLTTCFALTASIEGLYTTATSTILDQPLGQIVSPFLEASPPFVNAFEAVPDMLRDVRPGTETGRAVVTPFLVSQEEFSYHINKIEFPVKIGLGDGKHWPELTVRPSRLLIPVGPRQLIAIEDGTAVNDSVLEEATSVNVNSLVSPSSQASWERLQLQNSSSGQKTYADVVQETMKNECSPKSNKAIEDRVNSQSVTRMKVQGTRRVSHRCLDSTEEIVNVVCTEPAKLCSSVKDACKEEINGTPMGEPSMDRPVSTMENRKEPSSSFAAVEDVCRTPAVTTPDISTQPSTSDSSRKQLCTMAEMFCFGQLNNAAFFQAFEEYNKYRKRMSYTEMFSRGPDVHRQEASSAAEVSPPVVSTSSSDHQQARTIIGNELQRLFTDLNSSVNQRRLLQSLLRRVCNLDNNSGVNTGVRISQ